MQEEGITSIECRATRVVGLSVVEIEDVIELTTEMIAYVDDRMEQVRTAEQ